MHQPQHIQCRWRNLTGNLVQRLGVITEGSGSRSWLGFQGHIEFGAIVAHAQNRKFHRLGLDPIGNPVQHLLTCGGGLPRPAAIFKSPPRRSDSAFNICCRGALN